MIPENVTLIVKAPNQQIEDQNIECLSSWTVKQLKGHLSDVYPNKPRTEEQKIIYSGQLLDDNTILKDVLRTYDSQIVHTMHLVCTPSLSRKMEEDGLRRRNEEGVPRAETSQNQQNHSVEMQNYLNSAMNNYGRVPAYGGAPGQQDAASVNQLLLMQQAYVQYMQQYALWQASASAPAPLPPPPPAREEEEEAARDWLDQLYAASRLAVLASLVYLYGSGARLLLVIVLALAGYLHQMGFFRELNLNRQMQGNRNEPDNLNQPGNPNQPANDLPGNLNQPGNPNLPGNQNQQGNQNQPGNQSDVIPPEGNQEDEQRSLWSVTWMIFTTFFASLIPDAN